MLLCMRMAFYMCTCMCMPVYTVKNGVLHLHPYGCSTSHEHQAPLGVLAHTYMWLLNVHACVARKKNKKRSNWYHGESLVQFNK